MTKTAKSHNFRYNMKFKRLNIFHLIKKYCLEEKGKTLSVVAVNREDSEAAGTGSTRTRPVSRAQRSGVTYQ